MADKQRLTTSSGAPVSDNQNSLSIGPRGPLLIEDFHLIEKNAQFNRERIPGGETQPTSFFDELQPTEISF